MIKKIEGMHSESHLRYSRALFVFCNFNTDVAVAVLGSFSLSLEDSYRLSNLLTKFASEPDCLDSG